MGSVKLTLNIGAKDAKRLGLDKTLRGETVKVSKAAEDELIQNGWALRTNAETFPSRRPRVATNAENETQLGGESTGDESDKPAKKGARG